MRIPIEVVILPALLAAAACHGTYPGLSSGKGPGGGGTPVWQQLAAGRDQTCGVFTNGVAYCWGANDSGEVGDGTTTARHAPQLVATSLAFQSVAAGASHSCGLSSGAAFCWGNNARAQLGDNATSNRLAPVSVNGGVTFIQLTGGASYTCGVATTSSAYCWGDNGAGELGVGDTTRRGQPSLVGGFLALTFATVSAGDWSGSYHGCGVTLSSAAFCWGDNAFGELGTADTVRHLLPVAVTGGLQFTSASAGGPHSCALTTAGAAYCWGDNAFGELGVGDTTRRLTPTAVAGGLVFDTLTAGGGPIGVKARW